MEQLKSKRKVINHYGDYKNYPYSNSLYAQGIKPGKDIDKDQDGIVDWEDCDPNDVNKQGVWSRAKKRFKSIVKKVRSVPKIIKTPTRKPSTGGGFIGPTRPSPKSSGGGFIGPVRPSPKPGDSGFMGPVLPSPKIGGGIPLKLIPGYKPSLFGAKPGQPGFVGPLLPSPILGSGGLTFSQQQSIERARQENIRKQQEVAEESRQESIKEQNRIDSLRSRLIGEGGQSTIRNFIDSKTGDKIQHETIINNRGERIFIVRNLTKATSVLRTFEKGERIDGKLEFRGIQETGGLTSRGITQSEVNEIQKNLPEGEKLIYNSITGKITGIKSTILGKIIPWNEKGLKEYESQLQFGNVPINPVTGRPYSTVDLVPTKVELFKKEIIKFTPKLKFMGENDLATFTKNIIGITVGGIAYAYPIPKQKWVSFLTDVKGANGRRIFTVDEARGLGGLSYEVAEAVVGGFVVGVGVKGGTLLFSKAAPKVIKFVKSGVKIPGTVIKSSKIGTTPIKIYKSTAPIIESFKGTQRVIKTFDVGKSLVGTVISAGKSFKGTQRVGKIVSGPSKLVASSKINKRIESLLNLKEFQLLTKTAKIKKLSMILINTGFNTLIAGDIAYTFVTEGREAGIMKTVKYTAFVSGMRSGITTISNIESKLIYKSNMVKYDEAILIRNSLRESGKLADKTIEYPYKSVGKIKVGELSSSEKISAIKDFNKLNIPTKILDDIVEVGVSQSYNKIVTKVDNIIELKMPKLIKKYKQAQFEYPPQRDYQVVVNEITKYKNIVNYNFKLKNGESISYSYISFSNKPIPRFRTPESAMKYGSGKKLVITVPVKDTEIAISQLYDIRKGLIKPEELFISKGKQYKFGDKFFEGAETARVGKIAKKYPSIKPEELFDISPKVGKSLVGTKVVRLDKLIDKNVINRKNLYKLRLEKIEIFKKLEPNRPIKITLEQKQKYLRDINKINVKMSKLSKEIRTSKFYDTPLISKEKAPQIFTVEETGISISKKAIDMSVLDKIVQKNIINDKKILTELIRKRLELFNKLDPKRKIQLTLKQRQLYNTEISKINVRIENIKYKLYSPKFSAYTNVPGESKMITKVVGKEIKSIPKISTKTILKTPTKLIDTKIGVLHSLPITPKIKIKSIAKPSLKLKRKTLSRSEILITKSNTMNMIQKLKLNYKMDYITKTKMINKLEYKLMKLNRLEYVIDIKLKQDTLSLTKTKQDTSTVLRNIFLYNKKVPSSPINVPGIYTGIKPPIKPKIPKIPRIPRLRAKKQVSILKRKKGRVQGYDVYTRPIKKKGQKIKPKLKRVAIPPLPYTEALDTRNYLLDTSLARTGKVVKSKERAEMNILNVPLGYAQKTTNKFRDYRIKKGKQVKMKDNTVIEKSPWLLDSYSEIHKINVKKRIAQIKKPKKKVVKKKVVKKKVVKKSNVNNIGNDIRREQERFQKEMRRF